MKQAVLYVCHGSRLKEAREEAVAFISRCQKQISAEIHEICFLERAEPSIEEGFLRCIKQGATHIAVAPLLLLTAVHAKKDIPQEIKRISKRYPSIQITYGKPLGVHEKMAESVLDRVVEQNLKVSDSSIIVLIGRGSSDPDAIKDLTSIGKLVQKVSGFHHIKICFLTSATPSFEQLLEELKKMKGMNIFLVPYLLFTGLLMRKLETKVKDARTQNENIRLCRYSGYNAKVEEVFIERVSSVINR